MNFYQIKTYDHIMLVKAENETKAIILAGGKFVEVKEVEDIYVAAKLGIYYTKRKENKDANDIFNLIDDPNYYLLTREDRV